MEREVVDLIFYTKRLLFMIEQGYTLEQDIFLELKENIKEIIGQINYAEYEEAYSYYYSHWCE